MDGSKRLHARGPHLGVGRIAAGLIVGSLVAGLVAAPVGAQESSVDLEAWKDLLFEGGEFTTDPNYKGVNAGGTIGTMNVGSFPDEPLPWLSIVASQPWKIGYSIFNSAWPLPVAFAERGRLDGECFGVEVHTYENEADAAKGLQNAELMVQEGIQFAVNLQIYPDVNDQIAQMFDDEGIGQMFYAVPPQTIQKPFIDLPNYSTAYELGVHLGEHARDDWDGQVDLVLLVGQEQAGEISNERLTAGLDGIESVLGDIPEDKIATVDSGTGTLEEARQAVADFITSRPDVQYILLPGFADVHSVGAIRALEAAGKAEFAAASGLPGTPEGLDELRKGPDGSAFKVSSVQDLAFASWPVALATYALEGGELPDVSAFKGVITTAETVDSLPSQSNEGYACGSA
jgi:ABC-type sugar transport system substrate-binding protein